MNKLWNVQFFDIKSSIMANTLANSVKVLNVMIADNHPLTCKAYTMLTKAAFEAGSLPKVQATIKHSCHEVYEMVMSNHSKKYDLVILDIKLPNHPQQSIYNGEDIGKIIRHHWKGTKLLVVTSINDPYRLQAVLKSLNPEGFMLKNEICDKDLIFAIQKILNGVPFYSPTVLKVIKNQFVTIFSVHF